MNYTQNQKIEQVTESTLVLGVDIGSSEHYVRAFDYRGRELTRKVFRFSTDINGFNSFYDWVTQICIKHGKNEAMIGCEPNPNNNKNISLAFKIDCVPTIVSSPEFTT